MENIPQEINIKDRKYLYDQCNPYQVVLYKQIAMKIEELKGLRAEYQKTKDPKTMVGIHKGVGVLEFFQDRFDKLGSLQHITNLYELEKVRAVSE